MLLNRYNVSVAELRPTKVIQFGAGNFLRAFAEYLIQSANEHFGFNGNVAIVQYVSPQGALQINQQDGLYTLLLQGIKDGIAVQEKQIIDCVTQAINPNLDYQAFLALADLPDVRYIISNTTEAGIVFNPADKFSDTPASTFPAKLVQLLYRRFTNVKGDIDKGFIILPCELIENNGSCLKQICEQYADLWSLGRDFGLWLNNANHFCSTLVDRIVPGFPKNTPELGYEDKLLTMAEQYYSWIIADAEKIKDELIFNQEAFNVKLVSDLTAYRDLKVRILNGTHSALVPVAYLLGIDTVREAVEDTRVGKFIRQLIFNEIVPTIKIDSSECEEFANDVLERFANPFIEHRLMSIALNSLAKFKTRDLPIILDYQAQFKRVPTHLALSLAALLVFYRGSFAERGRIDLVDDAQFIAYFKSSWDEFAIDGNIDKLTNQLLKNESVWGVDLSKNIQLTEAISNYVGKILSGSLAKLVEELDT